MTSPWIFLASWCFASTWTHRCSPNTEGCMCWLPMSQSHDVLNSDALAQSIALLHCFLNDWGCYAPSHLPSSGRASDSVRSLLQFSGPARFAPLFLALSFLLIHSYPCSWFRSPMHFMFPMFVLFHVPRPKPCSDPQSVLLHITSPCSIFVPMFLCPNPCLFPLTLLCSFWYLYVDSFLYVPQSEIDIDCPFWTPLCLIRTFWTFQTSVHPNWGQENVGGWSIKA